MYHRLNINPFEIGRGFKAIAMPDRSSDGLTALNAVMPDFAGDYFSARRKLVVSSDNSESAARNAIWSLKNDRASTAPPQKFLNVRRNIVKIILRSAGCSASHFRLLQAHTGFLLRVF